MKEFVAPTIFMIAISSRRPKVVSLMVFDMMKKDTNVRITVRISDTTLTMFRIRTKRSAYSIWAFTFEIPGIASSCALLSAICEISVR